MRGTVLLICLGMLAFLPTVVVESAGSVGGGATFNCSQTEAQVSGSGAARVSAGGSTIYVGYQQVSGTNQNPIVRSFGANTWCRMDYETSSDDGRAYGLWWDGSNLYVVFSATGTGSGQNYNVYTGGGWLTSYGAGGGGQVSVVLRMNPSNGQPIGGTYITALLSNGNSNTARTTGITYTGSSVILTLDSAFSPRNTDRSRMNCSGYPMTWTLELDAGLGSALGSTATNCNSTSPLPSLIPSGAIGGANFLLDGRLNATDFAAPAAIYCRADGIQIWRVDPTTSQGTFAFVVSPTAIRNGLATARSTGVNTAIQSDNELTLYALTSGELQLNGFEINGSLYEFIFPGDACDPVFETDTTTTTITPDDSNPSTATGTLTHLVQPGENLFRIALRYNTTVEAIAAFNGIAPPYTRIYAGETLIIRP